MREASLRGRHTRQSGRWQFFQWEMICREEAQWGTGEGEGGREEEGGKSQEHIHINAKIHMYMYVHTYNV